MFRLYLMTILSALYDISLATMLGSLLVALILFVLTIANVDYHDKDEKVQAVNKEIYKRYLKFLKYSLVVLAISTICFLIIPDHNELEYLFFM